MKKDNETTETVEKIQWNTRIPVPLKRAVDIVCAVAELDREEFALVFMKLALGTKDERTIALQKRIEQAAKRNNLSFNTAHHQSDEQLEAA